MLISNSELASFRRRITACLNHTGEWTGFTYRSTTLQHANSNDILSGAGSRNFGGRWNPPDSFRTVYLSDSPETAMAESLAHYRYYSISITEGLPRVFVAVNVRLGNVLDLRVGVIRRVLRVSRTRLIDDPWREQNRMGSESLCQMIGRCAYEVDLEGLIVPSAATPKGFNLVIFPEKLSSASTMRIDRADRLPN